jgi:hypothetical protein
MPTDASRLYAKNVANLLALMTRDGTVAPDFDDDVIAGACLTHDGAVRHPPTAEALAALAGETRRTAGQARRQGVRPRRTRRRGGQRTRRRE